MFSLFKKKVDKYLHKKHFHSFNEWVQDFLNYLHKESDQAKTWLNHLHERTTAIEKSHFETKLATEKDIRALKEWVSYLHEAKKEAETKLAHSKRVLRDMQSQQEETLQILKEMHEKHDELQSKMSDLVTQSDTASDTRSDTVTRHSSEAASNRHISSDTVTRNDTESDTAVTQPVTQSDTSQTRDTPRGKSQVQEDGDTINIVKALKELNLSQRKALYLLINEEEAISYDRMAKKLDMNYSTVKNLVYRLRKKGIPILDNMNRRGEKEFYVAKRHKIALQAHKRG